VHDLQYYVCVLLECTLDMCYAKLHNVKVLSYMNIAVCVH